MQRKSLHTVQQVFLDDSWNNRRKLQEKIDYGMPW